VGVWVCLPNTPVWNTFPKKTHINKTFSHVSTHNKRMGTLGKSSRYQTTHTCWCCRFKSLSFALNNKAQKLHLMQI